MAHTYKLIYFDVPGKGEAIRMILSYGEIPFEDKRIQMGDWPKLKPTTPLGQLPLLEVDGKAIPQSTAICRYLASIVKLDGKDARENLALDVALETLFDLQKMNGEIKYEQDAAKKKEKLEKLLKQGLPLYFGKLDEYAKKHNGYIAFERVSGLCKWSLKIFLYLYLIFLYSWKSLKEKF
uniref:glutathione transferase n=1 Tax=Diabrotica virgifera virgifera TaxID=50390 RepID=A0A6P7GZZ4_DIAVI